MPSAWAFPDGAKQCLLVGRAGWLAVVGDHAIDIRVRVAVAEERLIAHEVIFRTPDAERPVTGTDLRVLQPGALEKMLAAPAVVHSIRAAWRSKAAPDLRPSGCTFSDVQRLSEESTAQQVHLEQSLKLILSPEAKASPIFYALVELLFRQRSLVSRRPAVDIAEANGVPVTTVHRWVKEARRRARAAELWRADRVAAETRAHERVAALGFTWEDYLDEYGADGAEDPAFVWSGPDAIG